MYNVMIGVDHLCDQMLQIVFTITMLLILVTWAEMLKPEGFVISFDLGTFSCRNGVCDACVRLLC